LLGGHPRIKELRAQIADLNQEIRKEAERRVRALENEARISGARVEALTVSLDQLKRHAASSNEQDVPLRALEREAKAQRDLLESYLAKYREAAARDSISAAPADARIISRASVSNLPVFPKRLQMILVATMLGNPDWTYLKHERFPEFRDALGSLRGPGMELADLTSVWAEFHRHKRDLDLTGNGVNHPNDFGHRVYAQVLSSLLLRPDALK